MTYEEIKRAWLDGTSLMVDHPDLGEMVIISPNTYELDNLCWNPNLVHLTIKNIETTRITRVDLNKVFPVSTAWDEFPGNDRESLELRLKWLNKWEPELKNLRKAP